MQHQFPAVTWSAVRTHTSADPDPDPLQQTSTQKAGAFDAVLIVRPSCTHHSTNTWHRVQPGPALCRSARTDVAAPPPTR